MKWLINSKRQPAPPTFDCHTHLLPGLDDGASSWEEAVELALTAYRSGTRAIILTPHYLPGSYEPSPLKIRQLTAELARRLQPTVPVVLAGKYAAPVAVTPETVAADALPLYLLPGCEAYLDPDLPDLVRRGEILTLGDRGTHLLVELPSGELPRWADDVLFSLALAGITPVLAHPERCAGVRRRPQWLAAAVERGALVQVNGESLTGGYGREVAKAAAELVRKGLVHFLGSDAHSRSRPPVLAAAAAQVTKLAGQTAGSRLAWANAAALVGLQAPEYDLTSATFSLPPSSL